MSMMHEFIAYAATLIAVACLGLLVMAGLLYRIAQLPVANAQANGIANAIARGAMTFLQEEYTIIAIVIALVAGTLLVVASYQLALAFCAGALLSMLTGFIGMRAATLANVRTTIAAKERGIHAAFLVAFFGGGVMGFAVAGFGLLGLGTLLYLFGATHQFATIITAFGLGASLVAFFARVGGGIYTKSADVGADLVGKLEAGIPEDDPRNPAVIADNVGDCVGDTAGMGADIFESYVGAMVSATILGINEFGLVAFPYTTLPMILSAIGLVGSIIGLAANAVMRLEPAAMLRSATYIAIGFFLIGSYCYISWMTIDTALFIAIILGCIAGVVIGLITEYYTASTPIERLANASRSGAATNIIYGLSLGMESTVLPVIILSVVVLGAYLYGGGLFGIALAAVAMLSTVGITMTVDAYGPIADNAGGIAEMSHFDPAVRAITDKLDALGNTTAAMGKGFAIGSALLTALALFSAYCQEAGLQVLNMLDPFVLTGAFVGGTLPLLISALTMRSVGQAALNMVLEVRRQFQEIPGLLQGNAEADYERCIAISTRAALREMILPACITVASPVLIWYTLGTEALGGLLVGSTLSGVLLALMMANGGGSWDNAKKFIEAGNLGGKGSDAHKAAVVGDMVGDPFKDTSGPSLNILIKLMAVVALLLVAIGK
ncbi:sodium-translocating pyrophosphatase [Candidatus Dependentiae bacterium]|nr:sodium-translocating pyrophosphatase [Candidatus Dependentiae bacterium]